MDDRIFHYRISPEVVKNDIFLVSYTGDSDTTNAEYVYCCDIYTSAVTRFFTGQTHVYSSMTQLVSGGTYNSGTTQYNSILTGLTIPIFITQNTVDFGYYSVFDGAIIQQETMTNFVFSATTTNPYLVNFYNTSDTEFKKYLSFSNYKIDWGDGSPTETVNNVSPSTYVHTYTENGTFTISMSGMSPWGVNLVTKNVELPFTGTTIPNPKGTAYFYASGGNWSGTPLNYDYIFSGDSISNDDIQVVTDYTTIPVTVSGYTKSTLNDLEVYGSKYNPNLFAGKYKKGIEITANTETIGTFWGPSSDGLYTSYTINDITYYDWFDGTTVFVATGFTRDMLVISGLTKDETFLNVIDEPQVASDVFVERGKQSGLEGIMRLGEIDNVGDLEKYGYGFFTINTTE
jgi:hypothetical protein